MLQPYALGLAQTLSSKHFLCPLSFFLIKICTDQVVKPSLYLMIRGLWDFDVQRTRQNGVPAGADVSLAKHWETTALCSAWHTETVIVNELWAHVWCLSPNTRRIHRGRSGAASWDGSARRPSPSSDVPGLYQRPLPSALQVWYDKSINLWKEPTSMSGHTRLMPQVPKNHFQVAKSTISFFCSIEFVKQKAVAAVVNTEWICPAWTVQHPVQCQFLGAVAGYFWWLPAAGPTFLFLPTWHHYLVHCAKNKAWLNLNAVWLEAPVEGNRTMCVTIHLIWKAQGEVRPVQTRLLIRVTLFFAASALWTLSSSSSWLLAQAALPPLSQIPICKSEVEQTCAAPSHGDCWGCWGWGTSGSRLPDRENNKQFLNI